MTLWCGLTTLVSGLTTQESQINLDGHGLYCLKFGGVNRMCGVAVSQCESGWTGHSGQETVVCTDQRQSKLHRSI
jgi:hypothetical protein